MTERIRLLSVQYMRHDATGWDPKGPAAVYLASPRRTGHLRDPIGAETHFARDSFIDIVPITPERMKAALARA